MLHNFSSDQVVEIIINTEKTHKKREVYIPYEDFLFFKNDAKKLTTQIITEGLSVFRIYSKIDFKLSCHTLRRTFATIAYSLGIDIDTICLSLGNTDKVCMQHYILSSLRNYDAAEMVNGYVSGTIKKVGNMFMNEKFLKIEDKK
jgi:site-specific recombinase XerD